MPIDGLDPAPVIVSVIGPIRKDSVNMYVYRGTVPNFAARWQGVRQKLTPFLRLYNIDRYVWQNKKIRADSNLI